MSARVLFAGVLAAALGAQACAGSGIRRFSTDWLDDRGRSIEAVYARVHGAKAPSTDLVVSVVGTDKLVGVPLGAGEPWTARHALDARPIIAGNVVVASGGGEIVALDAATGAKLWARPTGGLPILGAGDDGQVTAVALSRGSGSTLLVVGRNGSVKQQIETDKAIGAPAVLGGVVFVPWGNQYVSALDAATGDEIGRVVLRDKVSRAVVVGGELYFGESVFVRFDERIGEASQGNATRVVLPPRDLPGSPRLLGPGTEKVGPIATARDRDRLFALPAAEGRALDSDRFYASYYRLAFGFEGEHGRLAWVRTHPADFVGGDAVAGGLVLCDEAGKIVALDARSGQTALEKEVGAPIASCVVRADTFRAPPSKAPAPPLGQQIEDAVTTREATLASAQRLLLKELAGLEDESATKALVDVASDPRAIPVLVADARAALAQRRNGARFMLDALARHYDFLHDVLVSPPVAPLADALAAMKVAEAAPLLADRLLDPQVTDDDVKHAAAALVVLATEKELPALRRFFGMYRATAASEPVALAVGSVGEAMLRLDPKGSRPVIEAAASDATTMPAARAALEKLLAGKR